MIEYCDTANPQETCYCGNAARWSEGGWSDPWCHQGKCYSGKADDRCKNKTNGHQLGDGTWCWTERRDTRCQEVYGEST